MMELSLLFYFKNESITAQDNLIKEMKINPHAALNKQIIQMGIHRISLA